MALGSGLALGLLLGLPEGETEPSAGTETASAVAFGFGCQPDDEPGLDGRTLPAGMSFLRGRFAARCVGHKEDEKSVGPNFWDRHGLSVSALARSRSKARQARQGKAISYPENAVSPGVALGGTAGRCGCCRLRAA